MNLPAPQLVDKPQRMTKAKRAALDALAELGLDFLEYGTPPYAVSMLAEYMGTDLANLSKTMQGLERMRLVVREVRKSECWNAIAQGHMGRNCVCYWLAETMEQDKARAKAWEAGRGARAEAAFARMFAPPPPAPAIDAIDVSARILPDVEHLN